jgi:ABC-2 type transport system ATP-binding protein
MGCGGAAREASHVIEVENLTKQYGDRVAVKGLSFSVKQGEVIGFLGPNGAGKSTTLRMLTGYLEPSGGAIRVGGVDAVTHPIEARRFIGYMPESVPLYREMRVDEYLRYRARLKDVPRANVKARVDASLELANITDVRNRIIGQLSKGYRSRVGLADALIADPPLLVLDEPTAGLDPNQIRQVRDLVRSMAGHKTVLLSTHILPEVESTCGRVLIINKGQLVGEGAPGELRMTERGGHVLIVEGRGTREAIESTLRATPGVRKVMDTIAVAADGGVEMFRVRLHVEDANVAEAIFHSVSRANLVLRELRREQTSLEDVFATLTTADAASAPTSEPTEPGASAEAPGQEAP